MSKLISTFDANCNIPAPSPRKVLVRHIEKLEQLRHDIPLVVESVEGARDALPRLAEIIDRELAHILIEAKMRGAKR